MYLSAFRNKPLWHYNFEQLTLECFSTQCVDRGLQYKSSAFIFDMRANLINNIRFRTKVIKLFFSGQRTKLITSAKLNFECHIPFCTSQVLHSGASFRNSPLVPVPWTEDLLGGLMKGLIQVGHGRKGRRITDSAANNAVTAPESYHLNLAGI